MTFYALPPAETKLTIQTLAGGYFGNSPDFAERLCEYLGVKGCVLANSARSLLYLLFYHLRSRTDGAKTEVLVPGYTCYSVPAAAVKAGLKVSLYDMNPHTFQPDMDDVARKIRPSTLAVVGQHLLGVPSDMESLVKTARQHGIWCIEDAAQRLQSPRQESRQVADFTLYSFGRGKPLPLGKGGALIAAKQKELIGIPVALEARGRETTNYLLPLAIQIFSRPRFYWILEKLPLGLGQTIYDPAFAVSTMPRLYRKMGVRGLEELEKLNLHRALIGKIYRDYFSDENNGQMKQASLACVRYPLLVQNNGGANALFNLGVRQMYPFALCDLPQLRDELTDQEVKTPGAREIAARLITLPTHLAVNELTANRIAAMVEKYFLTKQA